jgi:hypothetical protein
MTRECQSGLLTDKGKTAPKVFSILLIFLAQGAEVNGERRVDQRLHCNEKRPSNYEECLFTGKLIIE